MPSTQDLELAVAATKVVRDLCRIKKGESLLITIDSAGCWTLAEETAKAGEALGAKVMVAWHTTPSGYGRAADPYLPDSLHAAIPNTDVWIEYNNQWLLYGSAWEKAVKSGRVRYLFLGGLNVEQIIRTIGKVDLELQEEFQNTLTEMTSNARQMRICTPAGTDVHFENLPGRPINSEGWARKPGDTTFLLGQIGWAPNEETIYGTIVFDGAFSGGGEAEIGKLREPIRLTIDKGRIQAISGGPEASFVEGWIRRLGDPMMYDIAHVCYGVNPGAKLSGLCTEDERVWGTTEWGFGNQGPNYHGSRGSATTHFDGTCLNSSVWLDGQQIMDHGQFLSPRLADLAGKLGKQ
jgi:2,5-dihydroxypyridine 5,6-dioxygenase